MSERGSWPNGIKLRINIVLSRAGAFRTRWSALGWWLLDVTAAIAIVCLGSALGFPSKPRILAVAGFVLQFVGTIAVLQDLDSTIEEFGGRPLRSVVRSFFVDLYELVRTPRTVSASMNIQLEGVTLTAHAASMPVESNGTLEDRVANLERRMRRQEADLAQTQETIARTDDKLSKRIDEEVKARKSEGERMFDRIKGAITGELHIKVGGVAYILLGTLLGTVASIVH